MVSRLISKALGGRGAGTASVGPAPSPPPPPRVSAPHPCCSQCLRGLSCSLGRWKWVFFTLVPNPAPCPFLPLWGAGREALVLLLLLAPQRFRAVLARVCSPAWAAQIKLSQAVGSDTSSPVRSPFPQPHSLCNVSYRSRTYICQHQLSHVIAGAQKLQHTLKSWGALGECFCLLVPPGDGGRTVVCSLVPPRRLCFLVCASGVPVCEGFGWLGMMLSSTFFNDRDASSIRSLMSVLVSLETVVEFLVVKTNLAHDKDTNTLVLSFSNRLDKQSALIPGTQQQMSPWLQLERFWPQNTRALRKGDSAGLVPFTASAAQSMGGCLAPPTEPGALWNCTVRAAQCFTQ